MGLERHGSAARCPGSHDDTVVTTTSPGLVADLALADSSSTHARARRVIASLFVGAAMGALLLVGGCPHCGPVGVIAATA